MTNKILKTRIINKHDTEANWAKATNFIPKAGEIIVYDDLNKIKIGNGVNNVISLPFFIAEERLVDVSVECDHEYEITGKTGHEYGVAIEDSQMLLKKIQGQTRRYSLNIMKIRDNTVSKNGMTYVMKDNVLTISGTATALSDAYFAIEMPKGNYTIDINYQFTSDIKNISLGFNIRKEASNTYTLFNYNNHNNGIAQVTDGQPYQLSINVQEGATWNATIKFMAVEGLVSDTAIPPFQPYDDTLVNSKCNLISTGRNLLGFKTTNGNLNGLNYSFSGSIVKINGTATANTAIYSDMNELLLNGSYYWKPSANKVNNMPCAILYNNTTIQDLNNYSDILITLTNTKVNRMLWYIPSGTTIDYEANIMLNYGNQPSEYEPYTQEELPINVELGAYDYIDNVSHLLVKQTSDIITLDGSSDENWFVSAGTGNYVLQLPSDSLAGDSAMGVTNNSLFSVASNGFVKANTTSFDSVDTLRTYLQSNPIQVSYKLATPTTTPISLPAGYAVYTGGLQQQVIEGKYLPYILYKLYSISVPSQILANIEIDRAQQAQINEYKSKLSSLESSLSNTLYFEDLGGV